MNKIKELREKYGLPQKAFAADIGVTQPTVSDWESGRKVPSAKSTAKIADYFGVTVDYILGREESNVTGAVLSRAVININVYGQIPAGIPVEAIEDIIGTEQIPSEWASGGREYFALQVKGDSMYPVYLDGDIVIVRKESACQTGDDCVVYINGYDATLKRVKLRENGSIEIIPLNVNYPPRTFTRAEAEAMPITIGGVVVELRRKIK